MLYSGEFGNSYDCIRRACYGSFAQLRRNPILYKFVFKTECMRAVVMYNSLTSLGSIDKDND